MPIARIVTSMPELSGGLVRDLNSRGFEVHIISPEQASSGTADLEIKLDAFFRPDGAQVPATHVSAPTTFAVPESAISALQQLALQQPQEDIWTMLASFDGDADTQDAIVPDENLAEPAPQEATATMHALNQTPEVRSESFEVPSENSETQGQIAESAPAVIQQAATAPERQKPDSMYVDPDLVPSMFNFSSFPENTQADQEATTSSNQSPWRGSELRKTNLRPWDARSHKFAAAAAAGCAVLIVLMILTFSHSHVLPKAVSSPAPETQTAVPFHHAEHGAQASAETASQPTVPIKPAVLVSSSVSSPSKAAPHAPKADTAVAEDTIVRYGSAKKAPEASATKPSAIRYYSDMD